MIKKHFVLLMMALLVFSSCSNDDDDSSIDKPYEFKDQYISGLITPVNSSSFSPYLLKLNNDGEGTFYNSTSEVPGKWTLSKEKDTLQFVSNNKEKWFTYILDKSKKVTKATYEVRFYKKDGTYEEAKVKYKNEGEVNVIPTKNQLSGNAYTGKLIQFGNEVKYPVYTYSFDKSGLKMSYGAEEMKTVDYNLYDNVAFRFQGENVKHFGIIYKGKLYTFRQEGLWFWGEFSKVSK